MYIKGTGMTKFGNSSCSSSELACQAADLALTDSGMTINDIGCIVVSNLMDENERNKHFAGLISSMFNINIPIIEVSNACAGGGTALWTANRLDYGNILVIGSEKLSNLSSAQLTDKFMMALSSEEQNAGLNFPAVNALIAQQFMLKYNITADDLALISFKNHKNAKLNPKARFYSMDVSIDDIKNSKIVASPLRLYDCSVNCDGAAAVILSKHKSDLNILASTIASDNVSFYKRESMTRLNAVRIAADQAYNQAGITPDKIDMAELHDAFTITELMCYPELGFCRPEKSAHLLRQGYFDIGGKIPINTSGGLKAKGHPISATGIAQIVEISEQLRGLSSERQVKNAKIGLALNLGGIASTAVVHIVGKAA